RLPFCRWSQSGKCWRMPMNRDNYQQLVKALEGIARIDARELHAYLVRRKQKADAPGTTARVASGSSSRPARAGLPVKDRDEGIRPVNSHVLPAMEQMLKLKAYSKATIKTYLNEVAQLLRLLGD